MSHKGKYYKKTLKRNAVMSRNIAYMCSIANNGWSSATANCLGALVCKKNFEITIMINHFSHTHTQRILKLPKLKDIFFF